jgi:malonyl-CoA decarboxylase
MGTSDRDTAFLAELFATITERSRRLLGRSPPAPPRAPSIVELARRLISSRGESSGVALAMQVLAAWRALAPDERLAWFGTLANDFGADEPRLEAAVEAWRMSRTAAAAQNLASAAEPQRQELFRRINLAPGGTAALVSMREELLTHLKTRPDLESVDKDFVHLLGSWFNRGFLMLQRIDWSSPAHILEKIIRYEAVHAIRDWDDLRRRLQPRDRRCFGFVHPQMPEEPLVFVEVALTSGIPGRIDGLLSEARTPIEPGNADTAVFYSISNTQIGLKGISFGNFLIKQVVEELLREMPNLKTFVTLSPLPGFAAWLARERAAGQPGDDRLAVLNTPGWHDDETRRAALEPALLRAAATYLIEAKDANRRPLDPVARFHLGNGARLERINAGADLSAKGLSQSHGVMVNYLYDPAAIEANHEAFANKGEAVSSVAVQQLLDTRRPARGLGLHRQDPSSPDNAEAARGAVSRHAGSG